MKHFRRGLLFVAIAALVASPAALGDGPHPTASTATRATVRIARTHLGDILVTGSGFTLFTFTKDGRNTDRCVRINGCGAVWPGLKAKGKLTVGNGLKRSLLSTIKLPSGARQVSYAGHPLYLYSFASGPGDTSYVAARQFGGNWYALSATGRSVK